MAMDGGENGMWEGPPGSGAGGLFLSAILFFSALFFAGCTTPGEHRLEADQTAYGVVAAQRLGALGSTEPFTIERPSDLLRKRLLAQQNLQISGPLSLGAGNLTPIPHWPDPQYPERTAAGNISGTQVGPSPLVLTLLDTLRIGAANSFTYQDRKEDIFRVALFLDLERDAFRNTFFGQLSTLFSSEKAGENRRTGITGSAEAGWGKTFESGAAITSLLAVDLANLFSLGGASSIGLVSDSSIAIPLLRGAGRHIVTEPMIQAERDVIYEIYDFERFKRIFAVDVAESYLLVLRDLDRIRNTEENYRGLIASAARARRLADAGRLPEIQVDQAVQDELRARNIWVASRQQYGRNLDRFKTLIGLPTDAAIELDPGELSLLVENAAGMIENIPAGPGGGMVKVPLEGSGAGVTGGAGKNRGAGDRAVGGGGVVDDGRKTGDGGVEGDRGRTLYPPGWKNPGPYEIASETAIALALSNRLDFRKSEGEIYDRQRDVVVAADALRAELTLLGRATLGERRSIASAGADNARIDPDDGAYSALLTLDLPLERTEEGILYRASLIDLEKSVRDHNALEDTLKQEVRDSLRNLLQARESLQIQSKAVAVAKKRISSTSLFLAAGRAQIRDLLEAQEALLSVQNQLTAAVVDYRVAELSLQRDMGLLAVDEKGMWNEFSPETVLKAKRERFAGDK